VFSVMNCIYCNIVSNIVIFGNTISSIVVVVVVRTYRIIIIIMIQYLQQITIQ